MNPVLRRLPPDGPIRGPGSPRPGVIGPRDGRVRRAFVATEAIIATGLAVALIALFAVATLQYAAVRKESDTRYMLRTLAAAELERIRAGVIGIPTEPPGGTELDSELPGGLNPAPPAAAPAGVSVTATAVPGEGAWKGLTRIRIVASKQVSDRRRIEIEVIGYIPPLEAAP